MMTPSGNSTSKGDRSRSFSPDIPSSLRNSVVGGAKRWVPTPMLNKRETAPPPTPFYHYHRDRLPKNPPYLYTRGLPTSTPLSLTPLRTRGAATNRRRNLIRQKSVAAQFASSVQALVQALTATAPHFIRCIKPNDEKRADRFAGSMVLQQLKYSGMIQVRCVENK